jgi:hypothetical protein
MVDEGRSNVFGYLSPYSTRQKDREDEAAPSQGLSDTIIQRQSRAAYLPTDDIARKLLEGRVTASWCISRNCSPLFRSQHHPVASQSKSSSPIECCSGPPPSTARINAFCSAERTQLFRSRPLKLLPPDKSASRTAPSPTGNPSFLPLRKMESNRIRLSLSGNGMTRVSSNLLRTERSIASGRFVAAK